MNFLVYLAGPIAGLTYGDSVNWRHYAATHLRYGIKACSPMRGKSHLTGAQSIQDAYEDIPLSSSKGITTRDRFDVMRCDVMLVNLLFATEVSKGTMIEIGWADAFRKPIVLAMRQSTIHDHPMVRECAGYIVPDLDEAIDIVNALLLPEYQKSAQP